ncbi:MAG: hypothetical protein E7139_06420 [Rikenellaceae bacterium]|nr:hypothetical protein [Rikenellaceae bacterium]
MKKIFYALSLAVALLTTSCTKDATEDILNGGNNGDNQVAMTTITVGINNATRVHLGDENDSYMPLYWSEGDKLSLNGATDSAGLTAEQAGGTTAEFQIPASLAEEDLQVIYPADICSTTKHFYLDSEVEYNPEKLAQNQPVLMGFMKAGSSELHLEHMCGYMRVQLTGNATVTKVMLRTLNHKPISGFHIQTITAEEVSMIDYNKNGLADGYYDSPVTTINCGEGVTLTSEPTNFDFAIPAGNYEAGFELTVIDSNNKQQTVAAYKNGKEIKAGVMTKMKPLAVNCTKEVGIYNDNAFIGYIRSLEKDCWLDNNNHLNLRADVSLKDFDRSDIKKYYNLIFFRSDYSDYNNDDLKVWDGHNFAICDYSATIVNNKWGAIFYIIEENWTIQNLKIGRTAGTNADCNFTFKIGDTTGYNYAGVLSFEIQGKVKNCVNNATANYIFSSGNGVRFSAFNGNNDNIVYDIQNCTNNGDINYSEAEGVTPPPAGKAIQIGGVTPRHFANCALLNCTNNGNITITTNAKGNLQIGGVIGQSGAANGGHSNTGNVIINANGVGYCQVGGIHGYSKGANNSSNSGKISLTTLNSTNACRVGGIVGSLASGTISNCHNLADAIISSNTNYSVSWSSLGGIVGYGSEENSTPNKITGCTNRGTIDYTGTGTTRVGGITGMTGELKDCTNYGEVKQTNKDCSAQVFVGGIGGSMHWDTDNCHNYGNVSMVNGGSGDAGGMAGFTTNARDKVYTNCSVDCTVTTPKADNGGIFFGYIAEANITMTGCKAYGKVVLAGTENTVTSENLSTLIFGESKNGKTIDVTNVTVESTKPAN